MNLTTAKEFISDATLRNWQKLSVYSADNKLKSRANKMLSNKTFIPKEYFTNIDNLPTVQFIISCIQTKNISIENAINSMCLAYLHQHDIKSQSTMQFIKELKDDYTVEISEFNLPQDENDFIGLIYQCLQSEGDKSVKGSYFTPKRIADEMLADIKLNADDKVLDPCCGSGGFLLTYNHPSPSNIFGCDIDKVAIKIAITNLIVKYKDFDFMPNIVCADFLLLGQDLLSPQVFNTPFDYIITNTPWGKKYKNDYSKYFPQILSKELFSYFIVKASQYLKADGQIKLLLPEAILNIKTHSDCRKFILDNFAVVSIKLWGQCFSSVQSNVVSLQLKKSTEKNFDTMIKTDKEQYCIPQATFLSNSDFIFTVSNIAEIELLKKIYELPYQTLSNSVWGLGIVTGDNKKCLSTERTENYQMPILTGKEIKKYICNAPKNYFNFDRSKLQQVAKDEIYLADEKLLYKFISNKLVFAYDNRQQFVLNSGNILIPKIDGMSIKTVMAFLNSKVMQFTYAKSFNQLKVIKGNLCKLPFPYITRELDKTFSDLVDELLLGNDTSEKIDNKLYKYYKLTAEEISIIERE